MISQRKRLNYQKKQRFSIMKSLDMYKMDFNKNSSRSKLKFMKKSQNSDKGLEVMKRKLGN
jgi:hypothetical protein